MMRTLVVCGVMVLLSACADKYENQINEIRYATAITENKLYNADFQFWQRGTTKVLNDGEGAYLADRWYTRNALGPGSQIKYSRVDEFSEGSRYAARVEVVDPPDQNPSGFVEIFQTLNNYDSLKFANQAASFSVRVKGLGRVTKVGLQFTFNIAEKIANEAIGPEILVNVSKDGYTLGTLANVAMGAAFLPNGSIGVRIRVAEVSAGNLYDLENGFVVKQAMLNYGAASGPFRTRFEEYNQEYAACLSYFEKSYSLDVTPGTSTKDGQIAGVTGPKLTRLNRSTLVAGPIMFQQPKAQAKPSVIIYSPTDGQATAWYNGSVGKNRNEAGVAIDPLSLSHHAFTLLHDTNASEEVYFHWTADAEIYP